MTTDTLTSPHLENQNFYYNRVQETHFWFTSRMKFMKCLLKMYAVDLNGKQGLEIGCGNSLVSSQFEKLYDCTVDGVDLTNAEKRFPTKGRFFQTDITSPKSPIKDQYDFLILFDLIEHIDDPKNFITSACRFLKPGGYILVNVPAYQALYSKYDEVAGHLRRYDSESLRAHLSLNSGATTTSEIRQIYWGFFFVFLIIVRKIYLSILKNKSDEEIYHIGFSPPGKIANFVLSRLADLEKLLLMGTSTGSSIMAIYRKL